MNATMKPRIPDDVMIASAEVIKCMGHPMRLRLLEALVSGEKSVSELQDDVGGTQVAVSQQLTTLKGRGLVGSRRQGAHMYYRITEPKVTFILNCIRTSPIDD
jgi:ArsR family transcriptional regulator